MDIRMRRAVITVDVRGADPVEDDMLSQSVMPDTAQFTYLQGGNVWAEVTGYKIKKDGSAGKVWTSAMFRNWNEWPDWVREMAEQVRPAGFRKDVDTSPS